MHNEATKAAEGFLREGGLSCGSKTGGLPLNGSFLHFWPPRNGAPGGAGVARSILVQKSLRFVISAIVLGIAFAERKQRSKLPFCGGRTEKGAVQKQLRKRSRGLNLRPLDIFLQIQFQIF